MSELVHLEIRKLTNDEAITYSSEVCTTLHLFPALEKSLEKVAAPFGAAVTLATSASVKVDVSGLIAARKEKNKVRCSSFLYFRGILSSALKSPDAAEREAASLLVSTLKLHDWKMQALPADKFSSKLNAIITAFEAPGLKAAMATSGADKAFAKMVAAHQQYEAAEKQRIDAKAAHSEVSPTEAMKHVYEWYSKLITVIEGIILTSEDPQLKDLVVLLNVLTEAKRQTIKAKATRAKNAKKGTGKPVAKKLARKSDRKKKQKQSSQLQPVEEAVDNQLAEQPLLVDHPVAEQPALVQHPAE